MTFRSAVFASFAAVAVCAGAHADTFDLSASVGSTPTFSVTSGGESATFSSPAGNGFLVQNVAGLFTFGNIALVNDNINTAPLTITFSAPVEGTIDIPFGIEDIFSTTDSLSVVANTGQSASYLGVLDNLTFAEPEGLAVFTANGPITSLTLSSTQPFGIGNVTTVAQTPEPTSLALLATGLAGIMLRRRRA